ncbi:MAG: arylsulfatase [Pseudomonadales bacterium]
MKKNVNNDRWIDTRELSLVSLPVILVSIVLLVSVPAWGSDKTVSNSPNIIIVMTDDQGYGDIGLHQNPAVQTPHIDQLAQQSTRLTNFHMDPTCSPSRASLLTGQYSMRAGVWHTIMGRSLLPAEHTTLAESLNMAGYKTAMFGKWHLGDNYPFRPQDQGFDEALIHGGGGVGQTPDYWGNTQFNDTYYRNGIPENFEGYATTIWFDEAIKFIDRNHASPFFTYISTNAPHSPWRAPDDYIQPYLDMGLPQELALFYAMITHLDEQLGRLRVALEDKGIADNTILVFATDNGSAMNSARKNSFGDKGFDAFFTQAIKDPALKDWVFNAGMRGFKASVYEGGHRVPLFIHWPEGNLGEPRDIDTLSAHFDLMPTLLDAANIRSPKSVDGISLLSLMQASVEPKPRTLFVTNQRVDIPSIERPTVVMTDRWRYVMDGENNLAELFDIEKDPAQTTDVKAQHPKVVKKLEKAFDRWWRSVTKQGFARQRIIVGNSNENPVRLTSMDWMEATSTGEVPWFPGFQRPEDSFYPASWIGREASFRPLPWYINAETSGQYQVDLYLKDQSAAAPIARKYALLEINGERQVVSVKRLASGVAFDVQLKQGPITMKGWFADDKAGQKNTVPAFYAYVNKQKI